MRPFAISIAAALAVSLPAVGSALAQNHVALVLDNGREDPSASARSAEIAKALERMHYRVVYGKRQASSGMRDYVAKFRAGLKDADIALFYYSGPAVRAGARNLLVASDARPGQPIEQLSIPLDEVEAAMTAKRANLVFVNSGYADPLTQSLVRDRPGLSPGMAWERGRRGFMVALANMPGKILQSDADNAFTDVLLSQLANRDLTAQDLTLRLRREVFDRSRGSQLPWIKSEVGAVRLAALPEAGIPAITPVVPQLSRVQRAALVKQLQAELKRTRCFAGGLDGSVATAQQGLNRLRQSYKRGNVPAIELASARESDFESWLEWIRAIHAPICAPVIVRRHDEVEEPRRKTRHREEFVEPKARRHKTRQVYVEETPRRRVREAPARREREAPVYRAPRYSGGGGGGGGGFNPFAPVR